jgi:beta-galactosidase
MRRAYAIVTKSGKSARLASRRRRLAADRPVGYPPAAMSAHRPSARAPSAPPNSAPSLERGGLRLGERVVPLWCGAVHYFRLPPARWRRALESLRALGLPWVETYVPWGVHETAEGQFEFGEHDPQRDLAAFLDLAHELGLLVFLRPGPNVNAELPFFGLPRRVVLDERNQARSARGHCLPLPAPPRMFPVPSYASRNFLAETERWFRAVAAVASPRRWPHGPVALLQVDNELAFFFRDAPYDSDYHPDALERFAGFLQQRYGAIGELNKAYGAEHAGFADVRAPRKFAAPSDSPEGLRPYLDWVGFHEHLLTESLATMARQLAAAGLDALPTVHNLPMGEAGLPTPISTLERTVDLVGLDYYQSRRGLDIVRKRTLRLAGSSKLAFAPELGVGAPPWFGARSEADALFSAMCACAYGLRGFNLYMAVDRDRWFGAPLDRDGEPRPSAERWQRLIAALQRVEFHRLRRRVEVALSIPKEYASLSRATHALGGLSPNLLALAGLPASAACRFDRFGFEEPIQLAWEPWLARLDEALCAEQIPFVYVESDADLSAIEGLRALFAPSFELAEPTRWQGLRRFADAGGTVLFGPQLPHLDARVRPHTFAPPSTRPPLRVRDQAEAQQAVRALASELALQVRFRVSPHPVQATVHEDEYGPRVLFLVHPGAADVHAELHLPAPMRVTDALSGERFEGQSSLRVPLAACSCRMLVVEVGADD